MQSALYAEINLVGIVLLFVILFNQRQSGYSSVQRQFNALMITGMIMLVVDAACWMLDGKQFLYAYQLCYLVETLYFILHLVLPYIWVLYTESALNTDQSVIKRRIRIATVPLVISVVALLFNLQYGIVFTIDANNVYHRTFGVYAFALLAYIYLIYASVRALTKAAQTPWSEDRRRYYTMAFFAIPPFIGGIIQLLFYGLNFTWFLATISILQVYIDSQNRQISTDPLTGLNNRRELTKFLQRETREAPKSGALTLVMMDIDGFKLINDTLGHFYGDGVLTTTGDILKTSCRNTAVFLARYGGDEFCLVLPAGAEIDAGSLISRIQTGISDWNAAHGDQPQIHLSMGFAVWDAQLDVDYESLIRRADAKMYEQKNAKKAAQAAV